MGARTDGRTYGWTDGSFTGVRIGIGIAQGLAFGADLPMIGISTLEAMAQGAYRKSGVTHVASAIDARMSEVYWGRFERQEDGSWKAIEEECVIPPAVIAQQTENDGKTWAKVGTGWQAYADELAEMPLDLTDSEVLYPESEDIVFLAQFEWSKGNTSAVEDASPVYLRDTVAWKKLPGRE